MDQIPAIDLFAGPGGLAEGFSSFVGKDLRFDIRLSIEKDPIACETLTLRTFFRRAKGGDELQAFYDYIRSGGADRAPLEAFEDWKQAADHVKPWTLGARAGEKGHVPLEQLHEAIHRALGDNAKRWVLLGGPPCQAYSVIGRSRMTGIGSKVRSSSDPAAIVKSRRSLEARFAEDHRHTLYREYLRVVAVHQPPIFVMENVKGILSSRIPTAWDSAGHPTHYARVFDQIKEDLRDPWAALSDDPDRPQLESLRARFKNRERAYRLVPFTKIPEASQKGDGSEFVVRAESHGVPQRRHRVIVLGIREDVRAEVCPLEPSSENVTVRKALSDLPKIRSALSANKNTRRKYGPDSSVSWRTAISTEIAPTLKKSSQLSESIVSAVKLLRADSDVGAPCIQGMPTLAGMPPDLKRFVEARQLAGTIQHEARSHMASDLARYLYLATAANQPSAGEQRSPTLESWPAALLPDHANVKRERGRRHISGFVDRFRVQAWDRPASTVTAHIHKDGHYFIHPDPTQCRSMTVREAARLQTFPDNYFFEGNRTEQFLQVGNAVPPFLALQLATVVAALICDWR